MDNASHTDSSDARRSKSHIVLPVEGGQRMLEHWEFQRSYGDYSRTQVIPLLIFNDTASLHII